MLRKRRKLTGRSKRRPDLRNEEIAILEVTNSTQLKFDTGNFPIQFFTRNVRRVSFFQKVNLHPVQIQFPLFEDLRNIFKRKR